MDLKSNFADITDKICRQVGDCRPDIASISDPVERQQAALTYYLEEFCDNPQEFEKHFGDSGGDAEKELQKEMANCKGRESDIIKLPIEDAIWFVDEMFSVPDDNGCEARHLRIIDDKELWITHNIADPSDTSFSEQAYNLVCQGTLYPRIHQPRRPLHVTYKDPVQAKIDGADI